jgi:hypothetical protein
LAIDFCATFLTANLSEHNPSIHLSNDKSILCYDGDISANQDTSALEELNNEGIFVVRSRGGIPDSAIKIANILERKAAIIAIRNYCISACASFIYVATERTYVAAHSVVAWHSPQFRRPLCENKDLLAASAETVEAWISLPAQLKDEYCEAWELQSAFFKKRGAASDILFLTKSAYVSRQINKLPENYWLHASGILWMWHPRYHASYFTTNITYASYPQSQAEVEDIAKKFQLPKIIYDR